MVRTVSRKMIVAGISCVALLIASSDADAGWRHGSSGGSWGSSGGSWGSSGGSSGGSWGSSGGSSGGSWGSSGGSWGGYRHYHTRHHGSWGSSGGSSGGSWGSSGGSSGGSWGSSGGSSGGYSSFYGGSYGYYESAPVYSAPYAPAAGDTPPPTPAPANGGDAAPDDDGGIPALPDSTQVDGDSVQFTVNVPADAKVFINGHATTSSGTTRTYVSRGLRAGSRYKYEIRAEADRDGKPLSDLKIVYVTAGQHSQLAFKLGADAVERVASEPSKSNDPPKTTLRLKVPADAKVSLAGRQTQSAGSTRVFTTTRLADGDTWENYVIRAELERDGRTLIREFPISLKAGETRELAVDFEASDVASVATAR